MKIILYYCKSKLSDLVLLSGDVKPVNPESEYAMAGEITSICEKLGVKTIYTLKCTSQEPLTMQQHDKKLGYIS